jgi:hypothetical protein
MRFEPGDVPTNVEMMFMAICASGETDFPELKK